MLVLATAFCASAVWGQTATRPQTESFIRESITSCGRHYNKVEFDGPWLYLELEETNSVVDLRRADTRIEFVTESGSSGGDRPMLVFSCTIPVCAFSNSNRDGRAGPDNSHSRRQLGENITCHHRPTVERLLRAFKHLQTFVGKETPLF